MITTAVTYTHRQTDRQIYGQTDRQTEVYLMSVKCVFLVTSLSTTAVTQTQTDR